MGADCCLRLAGLLLWAKLEVGVTIAEQVGVFCGIEIKILFNLKQSFLYYLSWLWFLHRYIRSQGIF
jgi:hypothetical protein